MMTRKQHAQRAEDYLESIRKWPDAEDSQVLATAALAHATLAAIVDHDPIIPVPF